MKKWFARSAGTTNGHFVHVLKFEFPRNLSVTVRRIGRGRGRGGLRKHCVTGRAAGAVYISAFPTNGCICFHSSKRQRKRSPTTVSFYLSAQRRVSVNFVSCALPTRLFLSPVIPILYVKKQIFASRIPSNAQVKRATEYDFENVFLSISSGGFPCAFPVSRESPRKQATGLRTA